MSFVTQEDVLNTIERLAKKVFEDVTKIKVSEKFERISYDYAMNYYGSDKPDADLI